MGLKIAAGTRKKDRSLFDGLLQELIQEFSFRVASGSPEDHSLRILIENTPDGVAECGTDGRMLRCNPAFGRLLGHPIQDERTLNVLSIFPEDYRPLVADKLAAFTNWSPGRTPCPDALLVVQAHNADGVLMNLECLLSSYFRDGGRIVVAIFRDLTFNRDLFEQLKESKENYDALSETITEAIFRIDQDFAVIFANSAVKSTFGYDVEEIVGQPFRTLFPPEVFRRNESEFRKYFVVDDRDRTGLGMKNTFEILGKHKNRGITPMEMSFGNSKDLRGRTLTCLIRDITQRKTAERRLRHLAFHDKLTGLGNRDLFLSEIAGVFDRFKTADGVPDRAAIMFLDLDGFKQVNDSLGHAAGDELLIETARRLRNSLRESDSVYRLGGDEFVVLLPLIRDATDAAVVASKLLAAVRRPFSLKGQTVNIGVSIGINVMPDHGRTTEIATRNADIAMYQAKNGGKNRYILYSPAMDRVSLRRWEIEQALKSALGRGEFSLRYQPLVDVSGRVHGAEALLQWSRPELGEIPTAEFIAVAEETGLVVPIGNWVLETACRDLAAWNRAGFPDFTVSVNLSARQFEERSLVETLGRTLTRTGANPKNLILEITETSVMRDPEGAVSRMDRLKKNFPGIRIAVDDFGTGYSSLSYLSRLPVDQVKIDASFVSNLFVGNNQKIVQSIIQLADGLGLETVAEGVETTEQWEYFKSKACRALQGFLFWPALERGKASDILARQKSSGPP